MNSLYGLVACGGESARMGRDKSILDYYGVSQYEHVYKLLLPFCEKVFLSCNESQAATIPAIFPLIIDLPEYKNTGPIAGLASAFTQYPEASFLMLGCDYPFLGGAEIEQLINARDPQYKAVSYSVSEEFYEPLMTVYERDISQHLNENISEKQYSLNQLLKQVKAKIVVSERPERLQSVDTIEAYEMAKKRIQTEQRRWN